MKTTKAKHQPRAPLLGEVIRAIEEEIDAAGKKLGFHTTDEDWIDLADQELNSYVPLFNEEADHDRFIESLPQHTRARARVLEQIWYLAADLLGEITHEDIPEEIDRAIAELRAVMELGPTTSRLKEAV